jgi:hypothetical protein
MRGQSRFQVKVAGVTGSPSSDLGLGDGEAADQFVVR